MRRPLRQLLSQAEAWNALSVLNWWYLIAYLRVDFFLFKKINDYTLESFQSSYFPFLLQPASACLERHRNSAVWKLVQLIQQHADLWLNLHFPLRPAIYLPLSTLRGDESHGKGWYPTFHPPNAATQGCYTLSYSTAVTEIYDGE